MSEVDQAAQGTAAAENVDAGGGMSDGSGALKVGDAEGALGVNKWPANRQEFYWRRQTERLQKELEAFQKSNSAELNLLRAEKEEALARMRSAEEKAARLAAISEAGLPPDLAALVPEAEGEKVKEYVEKLRPLADKLRAGGPGGTLTNPARNASGDAARLNQLAATAGRGDRRALREYAHLREKMRGRK